MPAADSVELFVRLVREKHDTLIQKTRSLVTILASEDAGRKKAQAEDTLTTARELATVLAQPDTPSWLSSFINGLSNYVSGSWTASDMLQNLIQWKMSLDGHEWKFDAASETAFDFDAVYEHYKKESRLPELFDDIIRILQDIHGSGAIDSNAMLNALGKVIATLKKCKDGSYFAFDSAWNFLVSFVNNYMWSVLGGIPVLGPAFTALDKAIMETTAEMTKVREGVTNELQTRVEREMKNATGKISFEPQSYTSKGLLSAPTATPLLSNVSA